MTSIKNEGTQLHSTNIKLLTGKHYLQVYTNCNTLDKTETFLERHKLSEPSGPAGGNVKRSGHLGNQSGSFLDVTTHPRLIQPFHPQLLTQEKRKETSTQVSPKKFTAALFVRAAGDLEPTPMSVNRRGVDTGPPTWGASEQCRGGATDAQDTGEGQKRTRWLYSLM